MTRLIGHRPRLAWDGARAVVATIEMGQHLQLGRLLRDRWGFEFERHVEDSWMRMAVDPDRRLAEAGLWRARLDDLLSQRPDLASAVASVVAEVTPYVGS